MKLLFCDTCFDVKKLDTDKLTLCTCGQVRGRYTDSLHCEWNGVGALLGFHNGTLAAAIERQQKDGSRPDGLGHKFRAFVIPPDAPTVKINRDL